jgi:hypothetical protein
VLPSVRNATVVLQFYIAVPIIATLLLMFAGLLRLLQTPHDWSTTSSSYAVPTASRSHNASCRKDTVTYALSVMFFFVSSFHLFIMSFYEHRVSWGTGRHSILWLNILFSVKSCSLSPCTWPPIHLLGCALFQHKPSSTSHPWLHRMISPLNMNTAIREYYCYSHYCRIVIITTIIYSHYYFYSLFWIIMMMIILYICVCI